MDNNINYIKRAIHIAKVVSLFLLKTSRVLRSIELGKENLILINRIAPYLTQKFAKLVYYTAYSLMFNGYALINDYTSAIQWGTKLLVLLPVFGKADMEGNITILLAKFYDYQCKYTEATELYNKALYIMKITRKRKLEQVCYARLGKLFHSIGEYSKSEEFLQQALQICEEISDKSGEAAAYEGLGVVFKSLGEYDKAEEHYRKGLQIMKEINDKNGEAQCYGNLGTLFLSRCEYDKAEEILKRALKIREAIGDKDGEATDLANLGVVFLSRGEFVKAEEFLQKSLQITKEICNKRREASVYENLGYVFYSLDEYVKAKEFHQKALDISTEIGDKQGKAFSYGNLGTVFQSLSKWIKAKEYHQKALAIHKEIGDKNGVASSYANLGIMFRHFGEYMEAVEYFYKALGIRKAIGDKEGEASCYGSLGNVLISKGEFIKAEECLEKALAITKEIGNKKGQASCYRNQATLFGALREYDKAKIFVQKAIQISEEIGDQQGIARDYRQLGILFRDNGEYGKAEEHLRNSLQITKKLFYQREEVSCYGHLGTMFHYVGEYAKARKFHERALELSYKIGDIEQQFSSLVNITLNTIKLKGNVHEVVSNLVESIKKSEKIRGFLRDNDQLKISFLDNHVSPYHALSLLFCKTGKHYEALHVVELGRARALADLMSVRYRVEIQLSADQESWFGTEKIIKESGRVCLYISYCFRHLFLWVIKRNKVILFRYRNINDSFGSREGERNVKNVFGNVTFRKFPHLSQGQYEDRSLSPSNISHLTCESPHECSQEVSRPFVTEDDDEVHEPPTLSECYKIIIAPVADLLDEPEIIIVPDRILYKVPFAAFKDESGKYLSESFRLRIVPSLMTLKLIQDSPADYHSQTGALIVGDPQVGHVTYKGHLEWILPLPCARKEAKMIGRLLGAQPLLGEHATKQAVLQSIHSVSLIHFAAHGEAQRGEIALAPPRSCNGIPEEEDYLLTLAEISQVRLTAKLVVLSCCHSARGQIRSEGVVGIARAFLGSGARSVLVALWAIQDEATEQFMSRFYEHLVRGESASESLHQAMKWMRANGFSDVEQWAPFMLIGDDVAFEFGK